VIFWLFERENRNLCGFLPVKINILNESPEGGGGATRESFVRGRSARRFKPLPFKAGVNLKNRAYFEKFSHLGF